MQESHPSMCTHNMLLRSTQGGCRYVTTHRSNSVRVHIKHRALRRTQEPELTFSGRHCCAFIAPSLPLWSPFFLVCRFFCLFTPFCCPLGCTYYQYTFNSTAPTRTVAVAVPMSTYEGCCYCTYDLQHSPWLLLLLLIVDQLVYHAELLLYHIYHPAHAFYKKLKSVSCEYDRLNV